ncbi:Plasmodium exported protein, unknown function [Plasmodium vivax]|uniref:Variable surface protein n=1 Tax=Plasmodium vivax TaxID=5855 RepID=A0A565A4M7_PLAVI|nr:Plasmodium exported protein, unknown function [Plasmodium vivax]
MSILKNIHIKENVRFGFFLNIFTVIILMWIYHPHDNFAYGSIIENNNKSGNGLNICFKRYLAEYEGETKIDKTGLYKNSPYYFENSENSNYHDYVSTYRNMKNSDSKKLKLYKTSYRHRYAKKKGLSKLDCYCEKKVFDKIDDIGKLAEMLQNNKKLLKKKFYKKFGIGCIILSLVPVLGFIIPLVHYGYFEIMEKCFNNCKKGAHKKVDEDDYAHDDDTYPKASIDKETWRIIEIVNAIFLYVTTFIVLSGLIYIFIKFIKYQRLKACRSKMSIKEYCKFCKSLFI